jgi:hypothetical protein
MYCFCEFGCVYIACLKFDCVYMLYVLCKMEKNRMCVKKIPALPSAAQQALGKDWSLCRESLRKRSAKLVAFAECLLWGSRQSFEILPSASCRRSANHHPLPSACFGAWQRPRHRSTRRQCTFVCRALAPALGKVFAERP